MQNLKTKVPKSLFVKNKSTFFSLSLLLSIITLISLDSKAENFKITTPQEPLVCANQLVTSNDLSFESITAFFSTSNGNIYKLVFNTNLMGIVTGDLYYPQQFAPTYNEFDSAKGLTLYSCIGQKTHKQSFLVHGKRNMGSNIYKYELFVLLPITKETPLINKTQTIVDLRKGNWEQAIMSTSKK